MKKADSSLPASGFTLVELTVVLIIVALLIGGMLVPLSAQRTMQNINETQRQLSEIKEALLGFAVINGRLPCPTTTADPADIGYGIEDATCNNIEAYLPWKSLGIAEIDPWGAKRSVKTDPFTGYWRYRVDAAFATAFTLATTPSSALAIQSAAGNALTQASPNSPVAIVYSTGLDRKANGQNVDKDTTATTDPLYESGDQSPTFDDMVIWISRPILFNRMISAGKLP